MKSLSNIVNNQKMLNYANCYTTKKYWSLFLLSQSWISQLLLGYYFNKFAILPDSFDAFFVKSVKFTGTVKLIVNESSFKKLAIN